jgi:hypothetical protein
MSWREIDVIPFTQADKLGVHAVADRRAHVAFLVVSHCSGHAMPGNAMARGFREPHRARGTPSR